MAKLTDTVNIGKELARQLEQIGITSLEQLRETGSRQAWLDIKATDPSACYNRLCGLEGAIQGVRWFSLPGEVKASLKAFYNEYK